ncbi:hypothetical protein FRC06_001978, partial [Ceratobasidium sp. 370]
MEEVEDEDMPDIPRWGPDSDAPAAPRRFPSPTVEDVEDEDMLDVPRCGPHPLATPTRPSLFPEPHQDPTAGVAFYFYEAPKAKPPLYETRLTDPETFVEAHWIANIKCSQREKNPYFELPRTRCWYWKNMKELNDEVDGLPHGPRWYRRTLRIPGDQSDMIVHLWMRDIIELVRYLIGDRRFMEDMRFAPERHFTSEARTTRVYDQMWSGDWWWRIQNLLGEHATVAPIVLAADKTQLTRFSGNKSAWPVYLTIGNISKEIRKQPSERATLLVGFIPVNALTNITNKTRRQELGWQLFHTCMELILEPLKTASVTGIEMVCADGGVRRVHPILASYVADYMEQITVACTRQSRCPICLVPTNDRGDWSKCYAKRTLRQTLDALDDYWGGYSRTIIDLGIRPTNPFWAELPFVEMATCLTPDLLHQINKGMFGEHLVNWCTEILGEDELDRRTKGMPRFSNLRHFSQGISPLSQWTGKEAKALGSVFVPIIADCGQGKVVTAARSLVDFMYRAHKPELSDDDLQAMERNLEDFHDAKYIFVDPNNDNLPSDEDHFNEIPKLHMLSHYVELIRELGAPDGYNTEITERLHIDYVKVPWDTTNHVNALVQMATYLQRQESWALLKAYLYDTGQLHDGGVRRRAADDEGDGEGEGDVVEGDNADIWYPTPSISIAKRPSLGSRTGDYLIRKHGASDLINATKNYLAAFTNDPTTLALSRYSKFKVWSRFKLRHARLPFSPATKPPVDQIRASPFTYDDDGQMSHFNAFDVVLIAPDGDSEEVGLHRFQAGRVRAIFEVPRYLQELCAEKLAYVELFRPFSRSMNQPASLYTTGNMIRDRRRRSAVVPISRIRMAIHLAPRYNLLNPDQPISASTDLLAIHNSFYLNKYASYFLFDAMEYWERLRQAQDCQPPDTNYHVTMVSSSAPSASPLLDPFPLRQLWLEPWPSDWLEPWPTDWLEPWPNDWQEGGDLRVTQKLYQATLERKLPKKRCRHTKDSVGARRGQHDKLPSEAHANSARPEHISDYEEIDSQLMQAARLASLEQFAAESDVLGEANLHAATPSIFDPSRTSHTLHSRSPTPPVEYNTYGCITARSKGKTRAY